MPQGFFQQWHCGCFFDLFRLLQVVATRNNKNHGSNTVTVTHYILHFPILQPPLAKVRWSPSLAGSVLCRGATSPGAARATWRPVDGGCSSSGVLKRWDRKGVTDMDPIPGIQATDPSERKIYIDTDTFFVGRWWWGKIQDDFVWMMSFCMIHWIVWGVLKGNIEVLELARLLGWQLGPTSLLFGPRSSAIVMTLWW